MLGQAADFQESGSVVHENVAGFCKGGRVCKIVQDTSLCPEPVMRELSAGLLKSVHPVCICVGRILAGGT